MLLVALNNAEQQAVWMKKLCKDLGYVKGMFNLIKKDRLNAKKLRYNWSIIKISKEPRKNLEFWFLNIDMF